MQELCNLIDELCQDQTGARGHAGDVRARHVRPAFVTVRPQLLQGSGARGDQEVDEGRLLEDSEPQGEESGDGEAQIEEARGGARQDPRGEPEKHSKAGAASHHDDEEQEFEDIADPPPAISPRAGAEEAEEPRQGRGQGQEGAEEAEEPRQGRGRGQEGAEEAEEPRQGRGQGQEGAEEAEEPRQGRGRGQAGVEEAEEPRQGRGRGRGLRLGQGRGQPGRREERDQLREEHDLGQGVQARPRRDDQGGRGRGRGRNQELSPLRRPGEGAVWEAIPIQNGGPRPILERDPRVRERNFRAALRAAAAEWSGRPYRGSRAAWQDGNQIR